VDAYSHESDERLELYALQRLPDSDIICIEEHLLVCNSCRDRLEEAEAFALSMRDAIGRNRPTGVSDNPWRARPRFALAGALAIAAVTVVFIWSGHSRPAPVASLRLTAMRGSESPAALAARELDLTLSDAVAESTGAPLVEVVDADGGEVWKGVPEMTDGTARAKIAKVLAAGDYLARFYDSPGHLLHEYQFRVK
jgi:hypothetical protein